MYPTDPNTLRTLRNVDLIKANEARDHHQIVYRPYHRGRTWRNVKRTVVRAVHFAARRHHQLALDRELPVFSGLSYRDALRLQECFSVDEVPSGTVLGRQGETVKDFAVILSGQVAVSIDESIVAVLEPGSQYGALPLLKKGTPARRSSLHALTDVTLARAGGTDFADIMESYPSVAAHILELAEYRRMYFAGRDDAMAMMEYPVIVP